MPKDKELLRVWLKTKRLGLPQKKVLQLSIDINNKLIELLNWQVFKTVHCYSPIESLNEVRTDNLLAFLAKDHPNIRVTLQDKSPHRPATNKFFDLIIVPTLGFDRQNYRIGWGGGYYDRFLITQPKALKIGLCFSNGLVERGLPREPHDIRLDIILTEDKIYKF